MRGCPLPSQVTTRRRRRPVIGIAIVCVIQSKRVISWFGPGDRDRVGSIECVRGSSFDSDWDSDGIRMGLGLGLGSIQYYTKTKPISFKFHRGMRGFTWSHARSAGREPSIQSSDSRMDFFSRLPKGVGGWGGCPPVRTRRATTRGENLTLDAHTRERGPVRALFKRVDSRLD